MSNDNTRTFFCFHKWSKWTEPKKEYDNTYQGSVCVKCGKTKYRSIFMSHFATGVMRAAYMKIFGDTNNE